ncbi:MAG TPA: hypothetical protein G4O11_01030 [Anaerolineae bacterium]|nr:hypothetical protein [Anaerolineae bacterium]
MLDQSERRSFVPLMAHGRGKEFSRNEINLDQRPATVVFRAVTQVAKGG